MNNLEYSDYIVLLNGISKSVTRSEKPATYVHRLN